MRRCGNMGRGEAPLNGAEIIVISQAKAVYPHSPTNVTISSDAQK